MSPLYIRPESLSPKDLSLVLLVSTPAEISKLYPCVLLISHHSGPRLFRGFCSTTVLSLLLSLLDEGVFRPYLDTCGDTLRWKRLHLPAKFDVFFLGTRLKMPEPTKKGRSANSEDGIRSKNACRLIYMFYSTDLLNCNMLRQTQFVALFWGDQSQLFSRCSELHPC